MPARLDLDQYRHFPATMMAGRQRGHFPTDITPPTSRRTRPAPRSRAFAGDQRVQARFTADADPLRNVERMLASLIQMMKARAAAWRPPSR
jgi:hypothetical protein